MTKRSKPGDSPGTGIGKSKPKTAEEKSAPPSTAPAAPSADKKTGDAPSGPARAATPAANTPGAAPAAGAPRPTHSRAPGQKEVIPFGWKVVGQSGGVALILFKSIERSDAEAHYERLSIEGYYKKLAIMENTAVVRQPKGAPKLVFTSSKSSVLKNKKKIGASKTKTVRPLTRVAAPKPKAPSRHAASPTIKAGVKSSKKKAPTKKSTTKKSATKKSITKKSATKKSATKKPTPKKAVAKTKARPKSTKKTPAKRR